jgi:hypothetical protein
MTEPTVNENQKSCLECGQPLGAGRSDRKFCNDICRTAYNNRRRSDSMAEPSANYEPDPEQRSIDQDMAAINKVYDILVSNRIKLLNMYNIYERRLSVGDFNRFGVNLKYFTGEHRDDYYEKVFRMCFDYGYHIDGNVVYVIYSGSEIFFN